MSRVLTGVEYNNYQKIEKLIEDFALDYAQWEVNDHLIRVGLSMVPTIVVGICVCATGALSNISSGTYITFGSIVVCIGGAISAWQGIKAIHAKKNLFKYAESYKLALCEFHKEDMYNPHELETSLNLGQILCKYEVQDKAKKIRKAMKREEKEWAL